MLSVSEAYGYIHYISDFHRVLQERLVLSSVLQYFKKTVMRYIYVAIAHLFVLLAPCKYAHNCFHSRLRSVSGGIEAITRDTHSALCRYILSVLFNVDEPTRRCFDCAPVLLCHPSFRGRILVTMFLCCLSHLLQGGTAPLFSVFSLSYLVFSV